MLNNDILYSVSGIPYLSIDPFECITYPELIISAKRLYSKALYTEALLDLNVGIGIMPEDPYNYLLRSKIRLLLEDFEGAINDFEKYLELSENRMIFHKEIPGEPDK
jgi:tetratricopeptide (TPR) repeat protein